MGSRRARPVAPTTVVFDTGALIALERGNERLRALLGLAVEMDATIIVPAGVLAQAWRDGAKQSRLSKFAKDPRVVVEVLDAETARASGALCARAETSDVIDASVIVAAMRHRCGVVTSDPADLERLAPTVALHRV